MFQKRQREDLGISIHHCGEGHRGIGYARSRQKTGREGDQERAEGQSLLLGSALERNPDGG